MPWTLPAKEEVALCYEDGAPQTEFAAREIRLAVEARGNGCVKKSLAEFGQAAQGLSILLASSAAEAQRLVVELGLAPVKHAAAQSYALRKKAVGARTAHLALGADATGAMYGGLDLAEAIRLGTLAELKDEDRTPYIAKRGIKFNLPLDARTPSYSDAGDAAQQNIPEMWSTEFWHEFLDEMARQRFNVLSLWNLHPFPSLVQVPDYPDVALADVMRTTVKFDSSYALTGKDMVRKAHLANLETLKKMTIEEKIRFWREVLQYAHDRGIEVYIFTWNIFVWGAEGKHGITAAQDNTTTIDYFRKSVREMLLTYPLLAGFGITAGENMQNLKDEFSNEKWLWKTYGEGICDVKKLQPNRSIRLIHRFHQTGFKAIMSEWKDFFPPGTFDFSYKYSVAHMYSMPAPSFAKSTLAELPPHLRTWMTVRNDDVYSFRWGDPEFARAYIRALPGPDKLAGYYMGPDGYIWGREFISTEPDAPRQLVMKKQWYSFMLWGRLSYDPALPDAFFEKVLAVRFPEVPSAKLFQAWAQASKIIPLVNRFYWNDIDLKLFPEACISHPSFKGFHTVRNLIAGKPMPASGILSIGEYVRMTLAQQPLDGTTPLQVAAEFQSCAAATLKLLSEMQPGTNKELRLTLGDLKAMAQLGQYYAEKTLGATALALFDKTGKDDHQKAAVRHLEQALQHWKEYAETAARQYRPQLLTRIGYVDLSALTDKVAQDIEIARQAK